MTAAEHKELANSYYTQASEHLNNAMNHGEDERDEMREYNRLYKLYKKHNGIYNAVITRKLNKVIA